MFRIAIKQQKTTTGINARINLPAVVTIGNFDGMHLGHQQLLNTLNQIATNNNYRRVVITFVPAPVDYFNRVKNNQANDFPLSQKKLCLLRDKFLILQQENLADELVILRFNDKLAHLTAEQFITTILIKQLNAKHVVVGSDFRFAYQRQGTVQSFASYAIATTVVNPVMMDNQRISSSLIRNLAENNQLDLLAKHVGRNLQYSARVVHGKHLGRKFSLPTINLNLNGIQPALWGIYAAYVYIEQRKYPAVISIGRNPTVDNSENYKLEAHLLDVTANFYGRIASVEVLAFIRCERKFVLSDGKPDLPGLFKQIEHDVAAARLLLTVTT